MKIKQHKIDALDAINQVRSLIATSKAYPLYHQRHKSHESDIYLNIQLSTDAKTQQSLKTFHRKLQQNLKQRELDKIEERFSIQAFKKSEQNVFSNRKSFFKKIFVIENEGKVKTENIFEAASIKRRFSNMSYIKKKSSSQKRSIYQMPILNQQHSDYLQRLLTNQSRKILLQRILRRRREEKEIEQDYQKPYKKCSINKRIHRSLIKKETVKNQTVLTIISTKDKKQFEPQQIFKENALTKFCKQKIVPNKNNSFLSPIKKHKNQAKKIEESKCSIAKICHQPRQQFGPWKHDKSDISFDV